MSKKTRRRKSETRRSPQAPVAKTVPLPPATHKPWQIAAICLILAVITIIAFRGVRKNDFLSYDDNDYVTENPQVQQGLTIQSIAWSFTTFHAANWHPLTWISHIVDWSLYGNGPAGHHTTNVYLHAANAVLLFLALLYMTGYIGRSLIVAFLFALHPAHVESVAWLAERKDVLCAFFWFATLLAYAWYLRKPSWKRYTSVVIGFACALMSKPMAVTLPLTLLLLDYWPLHRIAFIPETRAHWFSSLGKLCIEKWLLFLMAILSGIVTLFAQRASGAIPALHLLSFWERICNAVISYWQYVRLMFWPDPLTAFYYYDFRNIKVFAAILSAVALLLVTALCWHFRKQRPYCLAGWLWFLVTLVPVIGIVQVGEQAMAERYTYVPFIGLFIAVVWLAGDAVVRFPKIKVAAQLLAIAAITACAVKTGAQVKVWKDNITLFKHALEVDPRGDFSNFNLGAAYLLQGRYADAQPYLDRALVYNPANPQNLSYSAYCMMQIMMQTHDMSNLPLAGRRIQLALHFAPGDPDILTNMALWSALMNRPKNEEMYSGMAITADPSYVVPRLYLADTLRVQGKLDQAVQEYRHVLTLDPESYLAHYNLGSVLDTQGLTQDALNEFRLSLTIRPDQAMAYTRIGEILTQTHQLSEASEAFTQALRLDPANAQLHNDLGVVLAQLKDYQNAAEQFSDAVRIDPAYSDAMRNLNLTQAIMKSKKIENGRK